MHPRISWIVAAWVAVLGTVAAVGWMYHGQMREELRAAQAVETRMKLELERVQTRVDEQARTLDRLRNDPVFIERTVRQRLNYVKPGEVVFRFREE